MELRPSPAESSEAGRVGFFASGGRRPLRL